ncbi:MAG: hypothetical protein PF693_21670 [Spirochaetia bacterium]|jgi:hypothetical protein|nr:hypothetical protein [Spirochaetia bacterium]
MVKKTIGRVYMVEYLEILYWLEKIDFKGWYSMDQYPYREDAKGAINESIRWVEGLHNKMVDFGMNRFGKLLDEGDAIESSMLIREFIGI